MAVTRAAARRTPALSSLALAMLLASLGTSSANVALPALVHAFDAPFQEVQWVVIAYLLGVTTTVVGVGRLGDVVGLRRLLVTGVALFAAASVVCAAAPALAVLVAARAVQGVAAAAMMALSTALVIETVPRERTGSAMGLLGTTSAIGTALGPSLGGLLIATLGWRAIFVVNVPVAAAALALALRFLPADRGAPGRDRVRFDAAGTQLLAATLAAYALAMTLGRGKLGPTNAALLAAAAAGVLALALVEGRAAAPLVPPDLVRDGRLRAGLTASALVATVMMATLVVGPFYLAGALHLDAAQSGLVLAAGPLVAALAGVPAGRVVDRVGPRRAAAAGLAGMGGGFAALTGLPASSGVPGYVAPIALVTACYALFQAANTTSVMADVRPDRRGVTSGLLNLSRNVGLVTGASAMAAVFALATASDDVTRAHPAALAAGMRTTFAVAALLVAAALAIALARRGPHAQPRV
jgi:MFS family permease